MAKPNPLPLPKSGPGHEACIFCRIARGEIPAQMVGNNPDMAAFRDTNPQAPTHILVIPKKHVTSLDDAMDSAMLESGNLPMSSAEMASTMESAFFFTLMALSMPRRMPVMVTTSPVGAAVACARAGATPVAHHSAATAAATGVTCNNKRGTARGKLLAGLEYFKGVSYRLEQNNTHPAPQVLTASGLWRWIWTWRIANGNPRFVPKLDTCSTDVNPRFASGRSCGTPRIAA